MKGNSTKQELIKEALTRSVSLIFPSVQEFEKELLSGKSLKIYMGADPTGSHLHLGHLTNLLWLKRMQDLGHKVVFLVGDFTARIGDPTGKTVGRQSLNKEQVNQNMTTFKEQVSHIISFSEGDNPAEIRFNSEWYEKMELGKFMDIVGYFTVKNMLNRDMFQERKKDPDREDWLDSISLKELFYPLFQGYDGVAMDVDAEVGGNDQIYNMKIGYALRRAFSKERSIPKISTGEKFFVATTLLVNPKTGEKLMNKSEGGLINLDDSPSDIFGKVMALDDDSMFAIAEHCTRLSLSRVEDLQNSIKSSQINPRDAKLEIAAAVVEVIYGEDESKNARKEWIDVFSKKEMSNVKLPEVRVPSEVKMVDLIVSCFQSISIQKSKSEARRLILQGGVEVDGQKWEDVDTIFKPQTEVIKIGRYHFRLLPDWSASK